MVFNEHLSTSWCWVLVLLGWSIENVERRTSYFFVFEDGILQKKSTIGYWSLRLSLSIVNAVNPWASCHQGREIMAFLFFVLNWRFYTWIAGISRRRTLFNELSVFVNTMNRGSYSAGKKTSIYVRFSMKNFNEAVLELTCCCSKVNELLVEQRSRSVS